MFYNPGGPGELASTVLSRAFFHQGDKIHPEVRDRFDIIGMDLRGTGLSERLHCNKTLYNVRFPFYSTTEEQFQALIDRNRAFRQSCVDMTARPLIDYMDTKSIAKDYEAIRQALGGPKITYNGASCPIPACNIASVLISTSRRFLRYTAREPVCRTLSRSFSCSSPRRTIFELSIRDRTVCLGGRCH